MGCLSCGQGFHDECEEDCVTCHPDIIKTSSIGRSLTNIGTGHRGAPTKNPEDVKDKFSTGRKRAAQLYPLFKDKPCEWQGKKNCGGGPSPIIGCVNGLQQHRHHGPVKQVLRNEPGNVHRICNHCHARWHAVNDPIYDEYLYNKHPHSPEIADEMELLANEAKWRLKK